MPSINLTEGDDTFTADQSPGDDSIFGLGGNDQIDAGLGRDNLFAGYGADVLYGGDGNDHIVTNGNVSSGFFTDRASDTAYGGEGNDRISTDSRGDVAYGGNGNDTLLGPGTLYGGTGDDIYFSNGSSGSLSNIVEFADEGVDTIRAFAKPGETLTMPDHVENLTVRSHRFDATTTIIGNDANNIIDMGYQSAAFVSPTASIYGLGGDDTIYAGEAAGLLSGGDGNDTLYGLRTRSTLDGGDGEDKLFTRFTSSLVNGGSGIDTVYYDTYHRNGTDQVHISSSTWMGLENLVNTSVAIDVYGTDESNTITGRLRRAFGGEGDDKFVVPSRGTISSSGIVLCDGGDGYDTIQFTGGSTLSGGAVFSMVIMP